jgi:hypothetical protein
VSLFAPLDFGDEVEVAVSKSTVLELEIKLEGASGAVPADATNLAYRAAKAFAEAADLNCRIELRIEKRLPAGAGLGGGSSDAGAVLRALCDLFPGALDGPRLAELALELGADVPFFLDPRPAMVTGIGERLEAVDGLPSLPVLLANPGVALATADVFQGFAAIQPALTKSAPDRRIPPLSGATDPGRAQPGKRPRTDRGPTVPADRAAAEADPSRGRAGGRHVGQWGHGIRPLRVRESCGARVRRGGLRGARLGSGRRNTGISIG